MENFPWTRVAGVDLPVAAEPVIPRSMAGYLTRGDRGSRADGKLGGAYARP